MRRFVEDFASVDIGLLKRRGLFRLSGLTEACVDTRSGSFRFRHDQEAGTIKVVQEHRPGAGEQTIEVQVAAIRYGARRYFVCPRTFARASKLYFADGMWASRQGHGLIHLVTTKRRNDTVRGKTFHLASRLTGADLGKGPARGPRRQALARKLLTTIDMRSVDSETAKVLKTALRAEITAAERSQRGSLDEVTTRFALEQGRDPNTGWKEADILRELREPLKLALAGELPRLPDAKFEPNWLAGRPRLDVRTLESEGLLEVEELRGFSLIWDKECSGIISYVLVAADFRDPWRPFLLVESRDGYWRKSYFQIIPVDFVARRWYLICPLSGARKTTLYLREGRFGSEKALNLRREDWNGG